MNTDTLTLRQTIKDDLETLFRHQLDDEANRMAAFTPEDPSEKTAYMEKWAKIVDGGEVNMQTILVDSTIVGSVLHFDMGHETNVSYWIGRAYWGKGVASKALAQFIAAAKRPLFAQVAFDNIGSQKVLARNGFVRIRKESGFANARGKEIEEFVYRLD